MTDQTPIFPQDLSFLTKDQQKALRAIVCQVLAQMQSKRPGKIEINFRAGGMPTTMPCLDVKNLLE